MHTNFDFLAKTKEFSSFAGQAVEAERSLAISPATAAILARRALELAVRWVYVNDDALRLPYRDNLSSLIHEDSFLQLIEPRLFPMLKFIVKLGNISVHSNKVIARDDAVLSLKNLFEFCKWIQYCYADNYEEQTYDASILEQGDEQRTPAKELKKLYEQLSSKDKKLEEIRRENEKLREQMTELRKDHISSRNFEIDEISEAETRKKYIDLDLMEAGWEIGGDCRKEVPVEGMPNSSGSGQADYVLYGDNGLPLAVIEAKKAKIDPAAGGQQAKLYADCLQNQYHQRPLIFTTNGFEIEFADDYNGYPKRRVSGFFTKEELQLCVDRRKIRKPLEHIEIRDDITNRPYQKEAVTAVCDAIQNKRRKMLIVQATGSGKTRVSISIVDVLTRHNYVKNILFLADRKALVKQAKNNYSNLLPNLTLCNLLDNKDDPEQSRMIFSTYPTMMHAIDETKRKDGGRLFTPGHFDLIIVDESHRSIYKKYKEIFDYFDAMLLGMTATPKTDVGKNTYELFDLEQGVPTFSYELDQAVEEGYLVDYSTLEYKTKIMEEGIHYDQLTEEEKDEFDDVFEENETIEKDISASAINEWLFNRDTIRKVLQELMQKGIKTEGGDKLGKTIIFAKNSPHAKAIVEQFQSMYPEYGSHYIEQIDYSIKYADTLLDDFSTKDKMPQIAVSVDMLDTGIDISEILNLVFFKKVRSYAKFWQMIGRGTRLCKDLFGPEQDKEKFLIFDFCNNFDFFRTGTKEVESPIEPSLCEKTFNCKVKIARELQAQKYQDDDQYAKYRADLVDRLNRQVIELDSKSFRVKQHLRYVEAYRQKAAWMNLESVSELQEHIAPLVAPEKEDELARRFDYLIYSIELAWLQNRNADRSINIVVSTGEELNRLYTIPQVKEQKYIIEKIMEKDFWNEATVLDLEEVRDSLRELIQFIDRGRQKKYYTDFADSITSEKAGEAIHAVNNLENYKKKVEFYLKEHQDNFAVYKLRRNKKLNASDMKELERILWNELGTREDYKKEYGDTPVGHLVRRIVGMDKEAVNEAFSQFLSEEKLNINQIRFVRLMIDYISVNGNIEDNSILMKEPFRSAGSITVLFKNNMDTARKILNVAEMIKKNSEETA